VTIFGIIAILVWRSSLPRWLRIGFPVAVAIFVVLVGFARMAIDAHYPSDVLAGLLAGIGVVGLFAVLTSGARRRDPPAGSATDRDSSGLDRA
jgi:undecaprenyl-diphosphatase